MKNVTLYIRVSTDEQAEKGFSQRHQEEMLRRYCELHKLTIRKVIIEDYSAKTFNRPAWSAFLSELRRHKYQTDTVLFTKWDRFSRNSAEAYAMIATLRRLGAEPQAVEQPLDLSVPENKLMLAIYLSAPEVENDRRALNVFFGMRRAKKEGRFMGMAPVGYSNVTSEDGKRKFLVINETEAPIMRWVFEMIAAGPIPTEQIMSMAVAKGLMCSKNNFWSAIRNPVYCGKIYISPYRDEPADYVKGQHEPLITEQLFQEAQDALDGKKRVLRAKGKSDEYLPLRGFLLCPTCGRNLTGSASTGRNGRHYYYHCTSACGERFKAATANDAFIAELRQYTPHPAVVVLYKKVVSETYNGEGRHLQDDKRAAMKAIDEQTKKLAKARELLLTEAIDANDYKLMKSECEKVIHEQELRLTTFSEQRDDIDALLERACSRIGQLETLYLNGTVEEKRQLIGSVFPEKLCFDKQSYRTARLNEAVSMIYKLGAAFSALNEKAPDESGALYHEVTLLGLEPSTYSLEGCRSIQMSYRAGVQQK